MNTSYRWGNLRQDGKAQLYLRVLQNIDGRRKEKRIKVPGVVVAPSKLRLEFMRVNKSVPESEDLNYRLDTFRAKLSSVMSKYEQGSISFDLAIRLIESGIAFNSVEDYIQTVFSLDRKIRHVTNCSDTVRAVANHLGLPYLKFSDITTDNLRVLKSMLKPVTFNTYSRNLKVVWNDARERNFIYGDSPFIKSLKAKEIKRIKPKYATFDQVANAINRVDIKHRNRKTLRAATWKFEAIGQWLLMFSMRGFYPADLHSMSAYDLDFEMADKIEFFKKGYYDEKVDGNKLLLLHNRHKTDNPMCIFIGFQPILPLIRFLRLCASRTYPTGCFNNAEELGLYRTDREAYIKKMPEHRIDFIRLFNFDEASDPVRYKNYWSNARKRLRAIKMPNFQMARSTFMTISDILGIAPSEGSIMIGHSPKGSSAAYRDLYHQRIIARFAKNHLSILNEFRVVELYELLLERAKIVLGDFGEFLYDNCQLTTYVPESNPELARFILKNHRIPNYKEYQEICSSIYYHDLEAIEFARRSYEELSEEQLRAIEEGRDITEEDAKEMLNDYRRDQELGLTRD